MAGATGLEPATFGVTSRLLSNDFSGPTFSVLKWGHFGPKAERFQRPPWEPVGATGRIRKTDALALLGQGISVLNVGAAGAGQACALGPFERKHPSPTGAGQAWPIWCWHPAPPCQPPSARPARH
jgi:hypothetical protein